MNNKLIDEHEFMQLNEREIDLLKRMEQFKIFVPDLISEKRYNKMYNNLYKEIVRDKKKELRRLKKKR